MKQTIITILIATLVSYGMVSFAGSSSTSVTAPKESVYDRVMRTGTIRCGYGISPPVLVVDPNTKKLSGFDYDVWQEIGKELDLKIDFAEEAGWGNFIEGLRASRYDAFCSGMWADAGRTKYLSLTIPTLYSFSQPYVRADDHRFDRDLERANAPDVIIPAVEGDVSVSMAKSRFPLAQIHYLPQTATISDILISVQTKKSDIVFLDPAMVQGFEKENPGVLRLLADVPPPFVFGSRYGVVGGEIQLRDMIDVVLRKMIDDGRLAKLASSYSTSYIVPQKNYETP
jgi:ABC-type amino acid transport substrate-binding protein